MEFLYTIAKWISNIAGILSILSIILWILLSPKSDARFGSGYKDNAIPLGCSMPMFGIVSGIIAYYISDDGFMYSLIQIFLEVLPFSK